MYIESLSSTTIHKVWLKNCHDLKFISPLWKLKNEHFDLQAIASVAESYRNASYGQNNGFPKEYTELVEINRLQLDGVVVRKIKNLCSNQ